MPNSSSMLGRDLQCTIHVHQNFNENSHLENPNFEKPTLLDLNIN